VLLAPLKERGKANEQAIAAHHIEEGTQQVQASVVEPVRLVKHHQAKVLEARRCCNVIQPACSPHGWYWLSKRIRQLADEGAGSRARRDADRNSLYRNLFSGEQFLIAQQGGAFANPRSSDSKSHYGLAAACFCKQLGNIYKDPQYTGLNKSLFKGRTLNLMRYFHLVLLSSFRLVDRVRTFQKIFESDGFHHRFEHHSHYRFDRSKRGLTTLWEHSFCLSRNAATPSRESREIRLGNRKSSVSFLSPRYTASLIPLDILTFSMLLPAGGQQPGKSSFIWYPLAHCRCHNTPTSGVHKAEEARPIAILCVLFFIRRTTIP
jgi:hypothetical protein